MKKYFSPVLGEWGNKSFFAFISYYLSCLLIICKIQVVNDFIDKFEITIKDVNPTTYSIMTKQISAMTHVIFQSLPLSAYIFKPEKDQIIYKNSCLNLLT